MDSKRYIEALGKAVRKRRKKLGMSQEAFAEAAGVHRTFVGHIENAKRKITIESIVKIAEGLKMKPSELLKEAEKCL